MASLPAAVAISSAIRPFTDALLNQPIMDAMTAPTHFTPEQIKAANLMAWTTVLQSDVKHIDSQITVLTDAFTEMRGGPAWQESDVGGETDNVSGLGQVMQQLQDTKESKEGGRIDRSRKRKKHLRGGLWQMFVAMDIVASLTRDIIAKIQENALDPVMRHQQYVQAKAEYDKWMGYRTKAKQVLARLKEKINRFTRDQQAADLILQDTNREANQQSAAARFASTQTADAQALRRVVNEIAWAYKNRGIEFDYWF